MTFAQNTIPHHREAVQMAEMAADRAESPKVRDLAQRIEGAQEPEIQTMTEWLRSWGEDVPEGTGRAWATTAGTATGIRAPSPCRWWTART